MISIITPVYNTEKYLPRCLDSILAQNYQDWELLLIDDGSTDGSGKICDEYADRDTRIRVFHKANGGVASVRQLGIEEARGEFSIHVDSDDWVEPQMLGDLYSKQQETDADIVFSDFYKSTESTNTYCSQFSDDTSAQKLLLDILLDKRMGSLWNKLIRHDLYRKNNVSFVKGINLCEDELVLVQFLNLPIQLVYLNKAAYHYMDNGTTSLSRHFNRNQYDSYKRYFEILFNKVPYTYQKIVQKKIIKNHILALTHGVTTPKELKRSGVRMPFSGIFCKNIGNKGRLIVLLYIFGLDSLCKR